MLHAINLVSFAHAHDSLNGAFNQFLGHYGINEIREHEIEGIKTLVNLFPNPQEACHILDCIYISYKIPQINKEFDILQVHSDKIINIEIKKTANIDKIHKQLVKNKYYLKQTQKDLHLFSFISENRTIFKLDEFDQLQEVSLEQLVDALNSGSAPEKINLDLLFNPINYLVSPFNSPERFLTDEYFLTGHQEEIEREIFDNVTGAKMSKFYSITGEPGTGKTLLTYHIAKKLLGKKARILIIHCGMLNDGHITLQKNGWNIIPAKEIESENLEQFDIILVDEAQRIRPDQFDMIVSSTMKDNKICVFSHDPQQTLKKSEELNKISDKINKIDGVKHFKLTNKIRTNEEITTFIASLFDANNKYTIKNTGNIDICYYNDENTAKNYIIHLERHGWFAPRFTPSLYNHEHHETYYVNYAPTSHEILGQEFDDVVAVIDEYFTYNKKGKLIYSRKNYYDATRMLFQHLTRARKRLKLIIIKNVKIFNRCASILSG